MMNTTENFFKLTVVLSTSILATGVEISKEVFLLASGECPVFSLPLQAREVQCYIRELKTGLNSLERALRAHCF